MTDHHLPARRDEHGTADGTADDTADEIELDETDDADEMTGTGAADPFAALGNLLGGGGGLGGLLDQAMAMQQQLVAAQQQAAATEVEGQAGGGAVRITMTGDGDVRRVSIRPDVVDPSDVETLEDLLVAAFRQAAAQVQQLQSRSVAQATGGLDLGGLLGGLGR